MSTLLGVLAASMKLVTIIAGGIVIYYTAQAARRTNHESLWMLTVGLVFTGGGLLVADTLPFLLGLDSLRSLAVSATLSAVGLTIVVYSIFAERRLDVF